MKKVLYFFSALFFLAGCSDDYEPVQLPEQGEHYLANTPEVVRASVASSGEAQSRTFVDGLDILWDKGDAISYFGGDAHNCQYIYNGEDGVAKADFERKSAHVNPNAENLYSHAVYPYSSSVSSSLDGDTHKLSVDFPAQQTYAVNSFGKGANVMVAAGASATDEELFFRNASGYLVVNLYGRGYQVKSVQLSSLDESAKLAGKGTIAVKNGEAPVTVMSSDAGGEVTLDCSNGGEGVALGADAAHATAFWFALPPVKMEKGFRMTVTDTNGWEFVFETHNPVEITRNEVQPMEALRFAPEVPATHKLTYTSSPKAKWDFEASTSAPFDAEILSHEYDEEAECFVIVTKTPLTVIRKDAFNSMMTNVWLTSFTLPEGLVSIEQGAFQYTSINKIVIPGTVTYIGPDAFLGIPDLKDVTFLPHPEGEPLRIEPAKTQSGMVVGTFYDAKIENLILNRELKYEMNSKPFVPSSFEQGVFASSAPVNFTDYTCKVTLSEHVKTISKYMFSRVPLTEITASANVTIDDYAFFYCSKLKNINFRDGVAKIGGHAFENCSSLVSIDLTGLSSDIGPRTFYECTNLKSIDIPENVTKIGSEAFEGCYSLASATFPPTLNSIEKEAFNGCKSLTTIDFKGSANAKTLTIEVIKDGYAYLEDYTDFDPVNFYNNFKKGPYGPFYYSPLKNVSIDRHIVVVDDSGYSVDLGSKSRLFASMSEIDAMNVNLGKHITTLGEYYFYENPVKEIVIPNNITNIGNFAFDDCKKLSKVVFEKGSEPLTIGFQPHSNEKGPFFDSPLTEVYLGRDLRPSSEYLAAMDSWDEGLFVTDFYEDKDQLSVTMSENVKTIYKYMFNWMPIKEINIPSGVTLIDDFAFDGCEKLSRVIFEKGSKPLTIGFQPHSNQKGPFFDSPLTYIYLDRDLKLTQEYAEALDDWDEGVFAYDYWDDESITTKVSLQSEMKTIHPYMFSAVRMTGCWIPEGVTYIGDEAFYYCKQLGYLTMGSPNPPALGEDVFDDCDSLTEIVVPAGSLANYVSHSSWVCWGFKFYEWK